MQRRRAARARLAASNPAAPNLSAVNANGRRLDAEAITFREGKRMYFAHISLDGPVRYRGMDESIAVLDAPESAEQIGTATCCGWNAAGVALWKLRVRGKAIPKLWVIIDREFRPA